ncbi:DUF1269 domain-containing protein [Halomonas sp. McH1-25]|uniref:DUF1269 domain-containing protein n=1 Tax=unclassified Halomonas TaxID=2609666 RepID=UPI001EF41C9C|nr:MULTISPECIES: DUF1269 domain-containing protein [unclassified Halomonas]MCG7599165.1 DUF1269 domain-containing protein [Halomonas sp. McH1-25]MCP1344308.1 DUF1269 domain-containing protein [Halomonas sp. FL8]MCP1362659.1 DUF1269 domain-containing protein [Halomonas sp. BBD45]MCP1367088.1 DUF1269 domain-containing protein [Halomonas sp. BBD48]
MQRLYFLTPDTQTAANITEELGGLGLDRSHIHVASGNSQAWQETGVKKATFVQTTDTVDAAKRGTMIGAPLGLLLGLVTALILAIPSPAGMAGVIVGMGIFGGLFGLWASTLIGVSVPDAKVKKFHGDIRRGAVLMMVDIPESQEDEVVSLIHRHHPQVDIEKITREERQHAEGQGH